jgi:hypothetical protein
MSDSLKATVIVIVLASTISANGLLELLLPDPVAVELDPVPVPPLPVPLPDPPLPDPPPEPLEADGVPVEPAEIVSPGVLPTSETIVPPAGA